MPTRRTVFMAACVTTGQTEPASDLSPWSRWTIGAIVFAGAMLLFWAEPLVGKAILPWFGGSAAVWTTALLFFQVVLVVGYAAAHAARRFLSPAARSYAFIGAALASLPFAAVVPDAAWRSSADELPTWGVIRVLAAAVGAPLVVLAMIGPTMQEWFVRATGGRSPYRFYALSNLGSMVGLFGFPLVFEPHLTLPEQAILWRCVYAALLTGGAAAAWSMRRYADVTTDSPAMIKAATNAAQQVAPQATTWLNVGVWLLLAAAGSVLLATITSRLSRDAAPSPLLWVAPLATYLLTYVVAFDRPTWCPAWLAAAAFLAFAFLLPDRNRSFEAIAAGHLGLLAAGCLLLHGELSRRRPAATELTGYYLAIAVGGAAGGSIVAVIAPLVFNDDYEFGAALALTAAFAVERIVRFVTPRTLRESRNLRLVAVLIGAFVAFLVADLYGVVRGRSRPIAAERNFYGIVTMHGLPTGPGPYLTLAMRSGSTLHGSQTLVPDVPPYPAAYYGPPSGVGRALSDESPVQPRRIGVVGLGAGTVAAYARPGDLVRFYEINPAVVRFAGEYFTYLRECRGRTETILGDGRLAMESEPPQAYDVLVIDAFTSSAVPTHLLTVEAFQTYLRHVRDDGLLAIHVTNRHFDLARVVSAGAAKVGLVGAVFDSPEDQPDDLEGASWILLARANDATRLERLRRFATSELPPAELTRAWTDDYSSPWGLMKGETPNP